MACTHFNFRAAVDVNRLTDESGNITGYMADVRINCDQCGRPFQFLGLKAGIDIRGAAVSADATEVRLALCPQGEHPSALDRIAVHFAPERKH